ncbi:MAG: VOC family protein [Bacteroidota bacterium]
MKQLNVYLVFNGNCEEALGFYTVALAGQIEFLQRYSDAPMPVEDANKDRIMHARLAFSNIVMMFSDAQPGDPVKSGNQVSLSLDFESEAEQTAVFEKLAVDANVTMPLEDTFWGARFGMLIDKFGVNWLFNFDKPQA